MTASAMLFDAPKAGGNRIALPRVTVVVTCFNYGRFIAEALSSVAAQTYPSFDCIIVDDASTDGSAEIAAGWIAAQGDSRFRLIRNATNLGQMGCIAVGLDATESEFVALLDADDIWFPEFLTCHVLVHLNRVQPAGLSSCDLTMIDQDGRVVGGSTLPPLFINDKTLGPQPSLIPDDFQRIDPVAAKLLLPDAIEARYFFQSYDRWHWSVTSSTVYRRPLLELVMPQDKELLRLGADIYLMSLCHYLTGSFVIQNALGGYRRHGANNYASLPVMGQPGAAPPANAEQVLNARRAMLHHLLGAFDRLAVVFPPASIRQMVRRLFRQLLAQGQAFDDPNLAKVIGAGRVVRDRLRSRMRFLRHKVR